MYKNLLIPLAIVAFVIALMFTGLGGFVDMLSNPMIVSKEHAWNDGIFFMLAGIFLLLLARV